MNSRFPLLYGWAEVSGYRPYKHLAIYSAAPAATA